MAWGPLQWATPKWSLSRWLLFARMLQISGHLVTAVINGFLLVYIHLNRLGLATSMFCLEMMACVALIYSGIVLLMQHAGNKRRRSSIVLTTIFVAGDVTFTAMTIAIITVLARAGLPTDCHGLTRDDMEEDDAHNDPTEGYDTIRFGDGNHIKGQLDRYCPLERSFFYIAAALIFTYMMTVTLGVLRIVERRWEDGRKDQLFPSMDNVYQLNGMRPKIYSPNPGRNPGDVEQPSEGVLTPSPTDNPTFQTHEPGPSGEVRRDHTFTPRPQIQVTPVSPVSVASPVSQVSPISPIAHQRGSYMAPPGVLDTTMGGLMMGHSPDQTAEEAMVTDGYRYRAQPGMSSLPAYTPGEGRGRFMDGHGDESNEMRLSDYVKGETRAQNMKDSGLGI